MGRWSLALTLFALVTVVAGCGRLHVPAFLGGKASAPAGTRVTGTVQSVNGNTITLQDGQTFTIDSSTKVAHPVAATLQDLTKGDIVAITATKQADNSLLATIVNVFPASQQITLGQRPLDGGNLMTNATVDSISDSGFSVTFPNGSAQVKLAPGARISKVADGTTADIKTGATVLATVSDGVAHNVNIR
jgi:hypothetical protein